jgi:hypothetical protein
VTSRTARITIDAEQVRPSRAIAVAARSAPLLVLSHRAFSDLADELGDHDAAIRQVLRIATNAGKPIGINLPTADGDSQTVFLAPRGWSDERLRGWVAGHHEALESEFGMATIVEEAAS